MGKHKAAEAGIGYTIGNILIRAISFITLPIFTRLMSTDDYGLYSTYVSYESILALIISLGLYASLKMANIEYRGHIDEYVSVISLLPLIIFLFFGFTTFFFADYLTDFTSFPLYILVLMLFNALASSYINIYNGRVSLDFAYKKYLLISMIIAVGNVALSLLLMLTLFKDNAFEGRIVGSVVPITIIAALIFFSFSKKARPRFNHEYCKFGLKYSLPLIPHGLSQIVLAQFGKIVIQKTVSNSAAGIYGFAYTIVLIPQVLSTSFDSAWGPWFFEQYDRKNYDAIRRGTTLVVMLFSFATFGLCSISPEVIKILGERSFWESSYIIIPSLLGAYFAFLYLLPAQVEYFHKKTKYIAMGTMLAAVFNIVGCIVFIPTFGYESAVYVTLATYTLYFVAHMFIAYRIQHEHFPMNIKEVIMCIIVTCFGCALLHAFVDLWVVRYLLLFVVMSIFLYAKHNEILVFVKSLKKKG